MKYDDFKAMLAAGSADTKRLNAGLPVGNTGQPAEPQQPVISRRPRKNPNQARDSRRFFVHVQDYRRRLLDEDGLIAKYHVDALRYAGILPSDAPGTCHIKVDQTKIGHGEPERVEIEVWKIS